MSATATARAAARGGPAFRATAKARCSASRGKRKLSRMALALHERGVFTWTEWAATLGEEIKRAQAAGDPDRGDTYYRHWLAALERIVATSASPIRRPCALSRRLEPRRAPHAARHAD